MSLTPPERECISVYSRWWTTTHHLDLPFANRTSTHHLPFASRMFMFVFFILFILPYSAQSDDQHSLQGATRGNLEKSKTYRVAEIDISFLHPETKKDTKIHYQGRYGLKSLFNHVSGLIMHAESSINPSANSKKTNHSGCTSYVNKIPSGAWIALVERGDCKFTKKVRIATVVHNASAIVVYDIDNKNQIMQHEDLSSVSVFLNGKEGMAIVGLLNRGTKVRMSIWPGEEQSIAGNNISRTSVLFVSVSFIVLMVVSLAWLIFYYIQRFRYSHAKERLARLLACAAKKAIAKIPQKTIKAGDKELEGDFDQCAVCIEHYKTHDVIRTLPCRHVFHKSCIDPWLLDQRSCPMCKLDILRAYGMQVSGSQESVHRDQESGPIAQGVNDEPEVRFDNRSEVVLVPPSCLHVHAVRDTEKEGEEGLGEEEDVSGQAASSSHHLSEHDPDDITVLLPSSSTPECSHSSGHNSNVSRAQKRDKDGSLSTETKALISSGLDSKHQLSIDDDDDEDDLSLEVSPGDKAHGGHQIRSRRTESSSSSWTGSSTSLQGSRHCKEIDVSVEVNHESIA